MTSKDNAGTSSAGSSFGGYSGKDSREPSSARVLTPCAGTSSASSTPKASVFIPLARVSKQEPSSNNTQGRHHGVMVTTTIESETKPGSTAQLAQFSQSYREQENHAEAEEGRADFDSSVQNEYTGSETSITAAY